MGGVWIVTEASRVLDYASLCVRCSQYKSLCDAVLNEFNSISVWTSYGAVLLTT